MERARGLERQLGEARAGMKHANDRVARVEGAWIKAREEWTEQQQRLERRLQAAQQAASIAAAATAAYEEGGGSVPPVLVQADRADEGSDVEVKRAKESGATARDGEVGSNGEPGSGDGPVRMRVGKGQGQWQGLGLHCKGSCLVVPLRACCGRPWMGCCLLWLDCRGSWRAQWEPRGLPRWL